MGDAKDLNKPDIYAEALALAALDRDATKMAVWISGQADSSALASDPKRKWYHYLAERLIDLAPRPEQGFRAKPNHNTPLPKIGRNEPCPCGSGQKYKQCHLNNPSDNLIGSRLGAPTPQIRMMSVSYLIHRMPLDALERVPLEKASAMARTEMATVFHRERDIDRAIRVLQKVLSEPREDQYILYDYWVARLAEWLVEAERPKEAENFLLDEYDAQNGVTRGQISQKLAAYYLDQGDIDNGEIWVTTTLEEEPKNPFNHYLKGLLYHIIENWDEAVAAYEKAQSFSDRFQSQERMQMVALIEEGLHQARHQESIAE
ncbi:SEC-C metal-binding domain-containing protein [Magnetococcales bacterium HHB-1]